MQLIGTIRQLGRRGNVSVELAIISVLVLFPILAGGADFLELIAAKSQLNAALPAFYTFAWNNPASATDTTQLGAILNMLNQHDTAPITFADGKTDSSTTTPPTVTYGCSVPPAAPVMQSTPCPAADTQEEFVSYKVISKITLPLPVPFALTSPFLLTASGQIEIQ